MKQIIRKLRKEIRLRRARLIELANGIEIKENYPIEGGIDANKRLGHQKGIGITTKLSPEVNNPYFEIDRYGRKIPFDTVIGTDFDPGSPARDYCFYEGKDVGLIRKYRVSKEGNVTEIWYANGENDETIDLGDSSYSPGDFKYAISPYVLERVSPLIKSLELRLGRKLIRR